MKELVGGVENEPFCLWCRGEKSNQVLVIQSEMEKCTFVCLLVFVCVCVSVYALSCHAPFFDSQKHSQGKESGRPCYSLMASSLFFCSTASANWLPFPAWRPSHSQLPGLIYLTRRANCAGWNCVRCVYDRYISWQIYHVISHMTLVSYHKWMSNDWGGGLICSDFLPTNISWVNHLMWLQ